jgi:hypothetical protein
MGFFNLVYCFGASYRSHVKHFAFREPMFGEVITFLVE